MLQAWETVNCEVLPPLETGQNVQGETNLLLIIFTRWIKWFLIKLNTHRYVGLSVGDSPHEGLAPLLNCLLRKGDCVMTCGVLICLWHRVKWRGTIYSRTHTNFHLEKNDQKNWKRRIFKNSIILFTHRSLNIVLRSFTSRGRLWTWFEFVLS